MDELYRKYTDMLQEKGQYRELSYVERPNNNYLDFSSNDYLSLSCNHKLLSAALEAGKKYGVGAKGSRLLAGNYEIFHHLETQIAIDKNCEASLVFNTGFQANISVLASLLDQKVLKAQPIVFFDKLNHSSLYQAVFLGKAELIRYNHNDMTHLSKLLQLHKNDNRPKFIITETVFGMDGDILPLKEIVDLASKFNAFLYLDEAHATGIFGPCGYGLSTTVSLRHIPHLIMGTFSKALGVAGGYIACNKIIKNYLINKATGFIYSTANSPVLIGAIIESWNMIQFLDKERKQLLYLSQILQDNLLNLGFNINKTMSHIVPIIFQNESTVMKAKEKLFSQNIMVSAIRPPTVPIGTSRIRIALNSNHTLEDITKLTNALKNI